MTHVVQAIAHEVTKIIGSTGANGDYFGTSVAATDDYLAVTAHLEHDGALDDVGVLHIYERDGIGTWVQVARIAHPNAYAVMGMAVVIGGDIIAVSVANVPTVNRGSVWIIRRIAGTWTHVQTLATTDTPLTVANYQRFGRDLAMTADGGILIIGHTGSATGMTGWAWKFTWDPGTGQYVYTTMYHPPDLAPDDRFGNSVAVSTDGSVVVIGQPYDDDTASNSGSAWVYYGGSSQKLVSPIAAAGELFGYSVGVGANIIAVAASYANSYRGQLHIFENIAGTWTHTKTLFAVSRGNSEYLGARQVSGAGYGGIGSNRITILRDRIVLVPTIICMAYASTYEGSLWVFDLSDDSCSSFHQPIMGTTYFGNCTISKGKLIVASPRNTPGITASSGAVFEYDEQDWDPSFTPACEEHFSMRGYRPGTSDFETWIAVGAPNSTTPSGQPIVDVTVQAKWTA